jgi:hypothetical protein
MSNAHHTTDGEPPDPGLWDAPAPKPIDPKTGQHEAYYVLPASDRAEGFVRPIRKQYLHTVCGALTSMSGPIAETFAKNPSYYGSTFCIKCKTHLPVEEFVWDGTGPAVITDPVDWTQFERVGS